VGLAFLHLDSIQIIMLGEPFATDIFEDWMLERISFVCQAGGLEPQAMLLAASLRLHFPSSLKLLAAYPDRHGPLAQSTLTALDCLRVEIAPITNPLDDAYLIGHKIAAMRLLDGRGLGMFLDSDILAMRKPDKLTGKLAAVQPPALSASDLAPHL
jgi:hypothetical protein